MYLLLILCNAAKKQADRRREAAAARKKKKSTDDQVNLYRNLILLGSFCLLLHSLLCMKMDILINLTSCVCFQGGTPLFSSREQKALDRMAEIFPQLVKQHIRRKRFRKICADELPWKAQVS